MSLDAATLDQVTQELLVDEGRRTKPYVDTKGNVTIGVGYNLTGQGLPDETIDQLFVMARNDAETTARRVFPAFDDYSQNRRAALLNLAFNLGETKLLTFRRFVAAVRGAHWSTAADELVDSDWYREVQASRRDRVIAQIRNG